jgi:hypothetical protein
MTIESGSLAAERQFFTALTKADRGALDQVLADDFILIDVMSGSEIPRALLLELVGSRQLEFEAIEPADTRVRLYQSTAVITGRTQMRGRFAGSPFAVSSRYTHVYVERGGQWRLVTAQGTQIVPAQEQPAA